MLRRTLTLVALAGAAFPATASAERVWTQTGPLTAAREFPASATLADGRALLAGGDTATAETFDPATNAWSATAPMARSRTAAAAVTLGDGRVLVAGGDGLRTAELYDPATNAWSAAGTMNAARSEADAVLLADGRVLVVGGASVTRAELYNPATNLWTATATQKRTRRLTAAVRLPDGRVLVAGGAGVSSEIYDPVKDTWTAAADMHDVRIAPGAVALPDGRVLIAGGDDESGYRTQTSSEIFTPTTGTWTSTGPLAHAHGRGLVMLTLADGTPAMLGGSYWDEDNWRRYYRDVSELYDVATGKWTPTTPLAGYRTWHAAVALRDGSMVVAGGLDAGTTSERFVTLETAVGAPLINPLAPPAPMAPVLAAPVSPGAVAFTRPLPRKLKLSRSIVKVKLRCTGGPCSDKLVLKQWHTTLASGNFKATDGQTVTVSLKLKRKPRKRTTSVSLELAQQKLTLFASLRR